LAIEDFRPHPSLRFSREWIAGKKIDPSQGMNMYINVPAISSIRRLDMTLQRIISNHVQPFVSSNQKMSDFISNLPEAFKIEHLMHLCTQIAEGNRFIFDTFYPDPKLKLNDGHKETVETISYAAVVTDGDSTRVTSRSKSEIKMMNEKFIKDASRRTRNAVVNAINSTPMQSTSKKKVKKLK
jgi:hypothetical protein